MLFNSFKFAAFFPVVTLLYYLLPHRGRWIWLLLASALFYMAFIPMYIFVLLALILVDYAAGLALEISAGKKRAWILGASLMANLGILFFFKYFSFATENLLALYHGLGGKWDFSTLQILLPIGLSFHTFQSMSYTIEVYRGRQKAERHLGLYALYVLYFPQLVAGPIERPQNLLPQLRAEHSLKYENIAAGLKLIFIGLGKKVLVADGLAGFVNVVYQDPQKATNLNLLLASYFFTWQIFCDFSGYSDIARGSAKVLGVDLMVNFRRPYLAASLEEFWRRWHISLSAWFRDYVYIPLGGNRVSRAKIFCNLMVVFLLSGLWHGANWTFAAWGLFHGLALAISQWLGTFPQLARWPRPFKIFATFHVVVVGLVIFRAHSLSDAVYVLTHFTPQAGDLSQLFNLFDPVRFTIICGLLFFILLAEILAERIDLGQCFARQPIWLRWIFYYGSAAAYAVLWLSSGRTTGSQPFIYFQF